MEREIVTLPIHSEQVYGELAHLVEVFAGRGHRTCAVVFGYPWGIEYYGDSTVWNEITLPLIDLVQRIRDVEATGIGRLGHDAEPSDITEAFYVRWRELGYTPREFAERALVRTN